MVESTKKKGGGGGGGGKKLYLTTILGANLKLGYSRFAVVEVLSMPKETRLQQKWSRFNLAPKVELS